MLHSRKGFTLIELIIVMVVFMVVLMITGDAFKTLLTQMTKLSKSEESNIEGVVGPEMFRHDLQQIGYGLPFSYQNPIQYIEAGYTPASTYNDAPSGVPRAIVAGDSVGAVAGATGDESTTLIAGTDYLALKGTTLGLSDTAQKWTYEPYTSGITGKLKPRIWQTNNLTEGTSTTADSVIVIKKTFSNSTYENQMITDPGNQYIYWARYYKSGLVDPYQPQTKEDIYYLYGIKKGTTDVGMPFNRVDYFVAKPSTANKFPSFCHSNTGILYKAAVTHASNTSGAKLIYIPLLDCVADMQVVFGWDVDDGQGNEGQDGKVDTYSTPLGSGGAVTTTPSANQARVVNALGDAAKLRKSLKIIKVYLLAQVGRKDTGYTASSTNLVVGDQTVDGISKTYALTGDMVNYRWKLYRLVVRPQNLLLSQ